MSLFVSYLFYRAGKRRGRRQATPVSEPIEEPDCVHWYHYCRSKGDCDGMVCDYGE